MKHSAFSNINWDATYEAVKGVLDQYISWRMLAARFEVLVKSPVLSGTSGGGGFSNSNEDKLTYGLQECEDAKFEMALVKNTIDCMRSMDDRHELMADILEYKYIDDLKVEEVRKRIASEHNYNVFLPERTYSDLLKEACWSFAMIYPKKSVRIMVGQE